MKLSELRSAIESKYTSVPVELSDGTVVKLRPVLRLKDNERETVLKYMQGLQDLEEMSGRNDVDENQVLTQSQSHITEVLRTVTSDNQGDLLVNELGGDYLLIMEVFNQWSKETQVPEADSSSEQPSVQTGQLSLISNGSTESTS